MSKIHAVFFWFGGVLAPSIPEVMARTLFNLPLEKVNVQARLRMLQLTTDLGLGCISAQEFCDILIQEYNHALTVEGLETAIKNAVELRRDVLDVIADLPGDVERWILCDYPKEWYESARHGSVNDGLPDRALFTSEGRLSRLTPDIFYHLSRASGHPLNTCLMIDQMTPRAVDAIKHGLHAAIFVDSWRLRREFVLRRMLPPPPGFVHPGPPPDEG